MNAQHTSISVLLVLTVALVASSATAAPRYVSTPAGVPVPAPRAHLSPSAQPFDIFGAVANLAGSIFNTAGAAVEAVWPGAHRTEVAKPDPSPNPNPESLESSPGK